MIRRQSLLLTPLFLLALISLFNDIHFTCPSNQEVLHHNPPPSNADVCNVKPPLLVRSNDPPKANDKARHWCIISLGGAALKVRRHFDHFPHAAEELLPCWSWFRRNNAEYSCGYLLMDGLILKPHSWQDQLVRRAMNCRVREFNISTYGDKQKLTKADVHDDDNQSVYYQYPLQLKQPRPGMIRYLERPEDAHALRRRLVRDDDLIPLNSSLLHIGMIQRPVGSERHIVNFKVLVNHLQRRLPQAVLHVSEFNSTDIREQAHWFATKHVIIAAHGAALTNSLFITPGTIVMQLYPSGYFWQSLEPLIEQVGGIALDWSMDHDAALLEWKQAEQENRVSEARSGNITVKEKVVVRAVMRALGIIRDQGLQVGGV